MKCRLRRSRPLVGNPVRKHQVSRNILQQTIQCLLCKNFSCNTVFSQVFAFFPQQVAVLELHKVVSQYILRNSLSTRTKFNSAVMPDKNLSAILYAKEDLRMVSLFFHIHRCRAALSLCAFTLSLVLLQRCSA